MQSTLGKQNGVGHKGFPKPGYALDTLSFVRQIETEKHLKFRSFPHQTAGYTLRDPKVYVCVCLRCKKFRKSRSEIGVLSGRGYISGRRKIYLQSTSIYRRNSLSQPTKTRWLRASGLKQWQNKVMILWTATKLKR